MRLLTAYATMLLGVTTTTAAPFETHDHGQSFSWHVSVARWDLGGQTCGPFKSYFGPDIETESVRTTFPQGYCYTFEQPFTAFAYVFQSSYYTSLGRVEGTGPCTMMTYSDSECQDAVSYVPNAEEYVNMGRCVEGGEPAWSMSIQCDP